MTTVSMLLPVLGAMIVAAIGWDVVLTTIHPAREGSISKFANRASWQSIRALVGATGRTTLLGWAGPGAMVLNFSIWLGGLLAGYALIYLPFLDRFDGASQPQGFVDALYVSGVALTTVGFGDVVTTSGALRLVMVAEAATGLATFTAAIAYLLSVYPLFIGLRCTALMISDRDLLDPRQAAAALLSDGEELLKEVHAMLVRSHGHVRSFPVLYYFNPPHRDESIYTLMRVGSTLLLIARYGIADERIAPAGTYVSALDHRLSRIMADYTSRRLGSAPEPGDGGGDDRQPQDELRAIVESVDPAAVRPEVSADGSYGEARARMDAFLSLVAADRGYGHAPLLIDPADR